MNKETAPGRGDQTREALLRAAVTVFGELGYDGASTRALSRAAKVNQALIAYHFGSKRGLYLAVFEQIGSQLAQQMEQVEEIQGRRLAELESAGDMTPELAVEIMGAMFDRFIELFTDESSSSWVPLVLREQQHATDAFDFLYKGFMSPLISLLERLVVLASGTDEATEELKVLTVMLLGQVLIFRIARGTAAYYLHWQQLEVDEVSAIKRRVRANLEALFLHGGKV